MGEDRGERQGQDIHDCRQEGGKAEPEGTYSSMELEGIASGASRGAFIVARRKYS